MKIFTRDEIVNSSLNVDGFCGVYFLIEKREVVYVGKSINLFSRISTHSINKKFDSICFLPCNHNYVESLESIYIHSYRPKLNAKNNDGSMVAPFRMDEALQLFKSTPVFDERNNSKFNTFTSIINYLKQEKEFLFFYVSLIFFVFVKYHVLKHGSIFNNGYMVYDLISSAIFLISLVFLELKLQKIKIAKGQ